MDVVIAISASVVSGVILVAVRFSVAQYTKLSTELNEVKSEVLKTLTKIAEQNMEFHEKFINENTFKERVENIIHKHCDNCRHNK